MRVPAWILWIGFNLYPPLFWQGISVRRISRDFKEIDVILRRALVNRNLAFSAFGGSIFTAADPFFSTMYWQALAQEGYDCESWLKAAHIDYLRPGYSRLLYKFRLKEEDIKAVIADLDQYGKTERWHMVEAVDKKGKLCATVELLCFIRKRS